MPALPVMLIALLALADPSAPAARPTPKAEAAKGAPRRGAAPPPSPPAPAVAPASAGSEFERGKTAFSRAEYERAIAILQPLLYPETRLDSEGEVVQAHRMLGVAHLFEDRPADARREFRKLLELRPDYRFDPLLDPPRVVELFNDVVKEEENQTASLEAKRRKHDTELAQRRQEEVERRCRAMTPIVRYERHAFALNFLPFGAGQFQNGQRRKGWTFLGAEALLGAVSVAAFSSNFILFGFQPHRRCLDAQTSSMTTGLNPPCMNIDHSEEDLSRNLLRVQLVSGGLFAAVAIAGVIDAIRNFHQQVELPAAPPTEKPSSQALRVVPTLIPLPLPQTEAPGLGLAWTF